PNVTVAPANRFALLLSPTLTALTVAPPVLAPAPVPFSAAAAAIAVGSLVASARPLAALRVGRIWKLSPTWAPADTLKVRPSADNVPSAFAVIVTVRPLLVASAQPLTEGALALPV